MVEISEHWRRYYEERINRGWIDPDTLEPVKEIKDSSSEKVVVPKLPIDQDSLVQLKQLLLDLAVEDKNARIADMFFELIRRSKDTSIYNHYNEKVAQLFEIGIKKRTIETDDTRKPLPISEVDYIKLAALLGTLAINDSDDKSAEDGMRRVFFSKAFLYLQERAKNGNGFTLNDTIYGIEGNITSLVENIAKENENNITIQTP